MAFRSGINQVNGTNASLIKTYSQAYTNVVSGSRNNFSIVLPAGTFKCSLSYQVGFVGTGQVTMNTLNTGLSGDIASAPIPPMPLSSTTSIILFGVGAVTGQSFSGGTGFTNFQDTYISLDTETTIYLFNFVSFVVASGTPTVSISQSVTITEIVG